MEFIVDNHTTAATAGSTNPNFPAENIMDDHPKKVWKSTLYSDTLTVVAAALFDTITIRNTNAEYLYLTITDMDDVELVPRVAYDLTGIETMVQFMTGAGDADYKGSIWSYVGLIPVQCKIIIEVVKSAGDGIPVNCGIVWPGLSYKYKTLRYPIEERIVDYSLVQKLNNGATHIHTRPSVREYGCSAFWLHSASDTFKRQVVSAIGSRPIPWKLVNDGTRIYEVFGRLKETPTFTKNYKYADIKFNILEVI